MSPIVRADEPRVVATVEAIHGGDVAALQQILRDDPRLAASEIVDPGCDDDEPIRRTLLHVATDWPGHFPNVAATIGALVDAGAHVDARNEPRTEAPLHWAASSDDIDAIDALVAAGADIEAAGAVIAGGTPLDDAVAFSQWRAARRLVDHGAATAPWHAAALGLIDRVEQHFAAAPSAPSPYPWGASSGTPPDELTVAFWCACHGGQRRTAEHLLDRGADLDWISVWDGLTPLDAARREGADELVAWLRTRGARSAHEAASRHDARD